MAPHHHVGNWYFGWNIVAVGTMLTLLSVGLRMGIGPFFLPIADNMGFSRGLLSSIIAAAMLMYGLMMPLAGWLVEHVGTRRVLIIGSLLVLIGAVWTINAHSALMFALGFAVILSIGLALTSPVTVTPVLSRWFIRQRGMALFFLSTGGMAGLAVVTPVLTWGIQAFGWRETLVGYAVIFVILTIPGALLVIRDRAPEHADLHVHTENGQPVPADVVSPLADTPSLPFLKAVFSKPFWLITIGLFANGFSMTLLGTHGIPMLVDHGFTPGIASLGIGLIGLVAIFGTVFLGRIADAVPRRYLLTAIYFVRGAAFIGLMLVLTHWELYLVAFVGGLVWAGSMAVSSAIMADIYGVKLLGVLYGVAYLGQQIAGMLAAWMGGWGHETFGTHWVAYGACIVILVIGGVASLALPHRGFRLPQPKAATTN